MPIVEVKNLFKYYSKPDNPKEKFAAVDDVSFAIEEGETFGILGPNGAGKTTTLEMLEGLKVIEKGEAVIAGISVKKDPMKVKQIIGVQLQESHYFDFSVGQKNLLKNEFSLNKFLDKFIHLVNLIS